ncbi:cAMP-dependent protein kinase catalytic subunit [Brettanomyces nanus]|uniref:cAMP-dependent protein kinase n=1 Tax=Eeniella nana TaxID=13502 RepID=A0A875SBL4_EENNA|nr:cAMP-dependent protein kinase catalytic subunit [Brettanomyces nanus]QPG77112.1 cAMP-dependent protein kinase catalytic subunit [Brettanomyces nanus]
MQADYNRKYMEHALKLAQLKIREVPGMRGENECESTSQNELQDQVEGQSPNLRLDVQQGLHLDAPPGQQGQPQPQPQPGADSRRCAIQLEEGHQPQQDFQHSTPPQNDDDDYSAPPQSTTPVAAAGASRGRSISSSGPSKLPVRVTKGKYSLTDFEIVRTLGTGSFGRVHLVRSVHNGRYYAMKVFRKSRVVSAKQIEHTNDERRIMAITHHPFITRMWGTFQDCKSIFIIMDYIEGGELFTLLRRSKTFPNQVAKFYSAEVLLALEYLHSKNIIYRDLKPENILLARSGHIKLADFGFAKEVETNTYTLCGTPDYIAPEVIAFQPYNKAVDWWSFGILIFEMLAGRTPFYDASPIKTYEKITQCHVYYPTSFHPDATSLLKGLITKDVTYRLGNLKNGVDDIKNHSWFKEVVWENLIQGNIETPYEPNIPTGVGDSSQFDVYPEGSYDYGTTGIKDEYGHLFPDF